MPKQNAVFDIRGPNVYFVFVINVFSLLYNMCVCHLFVNKESSTEFGKLFHILTIRAVKMFS